MYSQYGVYIMFTICTIYTYIPTENFLFANNLELVANGLQMSCEWLLSVAKFLLN